MARPQQSLEVRSHLVRALQADLIGPFDPESGQELLRMPPSRWYLTGFLANEILCQADDDTQEGELASGDDLDEVETAGSREQEPSVRRFLPASMGMTMLLAPGTDSIKVRLRYADYAALTRKELDEIGLKPERKHREGATTLWWKRMPRDWIDIDVLVVASGDDPTVLIPQSRGIEIVTRSEPTKDVPGVDDGALATSVFVVNRRSGVDDVRNPRRDEDYIFQVEMEVRAPGRLLPRPDRHLEHARDDDDRIIDLQYRDRKEWGVGHGCATEEIVQDGTVVGCRSTWLPTAEVEKVTTREQDGVVTLMERLADLRSAEDVRSGLGVLPSAYKGWIDAQRDKPIDSSKRKETQQILVARAEKALRRIEAGIQLLENDEQARQAFCLANRAMAMSQRQRRPDSAPAWRLFQLAFILLNLRGIVDPTHDDRETVDLIFFPTGGGKTEAYLGVVAFTLLLRRMRGQSRPDRGLGMAVLLRYTLRLLTLDQLQRAAGLVCALELLRREMLTVLGEDRYTIGLWVGRSASANRLKEAKKLVEEFRNRTGPSPFPLTNCPWCGEEIGRQSLTTRSFKGAIAEIVATCVSRKEDCPFARGPNSHEGLPVLFVDEQIYRELPSFVVATVDKFAMLPWRGETGMLFGRVHSRQGKQFFGPVDGRSPGAGSETLPHGLRPPELIIQDELHLIAGPLGTMVGLYETMVEQLAVDRSAGDKPLRPKIMAATATVRRSGKQIQALFGRKNSQIFPPAGVDAWDTFFAKMDEQAARRMYVGVAAGGRPMKRILINTYLTLLAGAERMYERSGHPPDSSPEGAQPADPYMTLVGYFNSLRELGGMRRLVEDEIHGRSSEIARRRPEDWAGEHPWLANRRIALEPIELTSREPTPKIAQAKERLARNFEQDGHVDVCLASNMISVGVDIDRLGLMVVGGQPKTTSEYIQASSRVGRQDNWPGLVVTVYNLHKPRDRSHYEHFCGYHRSFYRYVESQSLTPFSGPALDRGFAAVVVGMTRLCESALTAPKAIADLPKYRAIGEQMVEALASRASLHNDDVDGQRLANELRERGRSLLDSWEKILKTASEGAGARRYSPFDNLKEGKPLLHMVGSSLPADQHEAKFHAPTSMRDVESSVHIWVDRSGYGRG